MPAGPELNAFIRTYFRSVWTLELLLYLKANCRAACRVEILVSALRASDSIVSQGIASLSTAGLVVTDEDGGVRYSPVSQELEQAMDKVQLLYAARPDAIRRLIVTSSNTGLSAFADSFRLRRD
jgi:hypothetical protein